MLTCSTVVRFHKSNCFGSAPFSRDYTFPSCICEDIRVEDWAYPNMVVEEKRHRGEYDHTQQEAHSCSGTVLYRSMKGDLIVMTDHGEVKSGENDNVDTSDGLHLK